MITKRAGSSASTMLVTFQLPSAIAAQEVHLVGDFNGWDRRSLPLQHLARDGVWEISHTGGHRFAGVLVALPEGTVYGRVAAGHVPDLLRARARSEVVPRLLRHASLRRKVDRQHLLRAAYEILEVQAGGGAVHMLMVRSSSGPQLRDALDTKRPVRLGGHTSRAAEQLENLASLSSMTAHPQYVDCLVDKV